jgi:hypothetical protein
VDRLQSLSSDEPRRCSGGCVSRAQVVWLISKEFDTIVQIGYKFFDYVIRRLNALLTGDKGWLKGLTFAETPLSAISRFNWSPESPEARPLIESAREDGSSFRADLEQSTSKQKGVYEIR